MKATRFNRTVAVITIFLAFVGCAKDQPPGKQAGSVGIDEARPIMKAKLANAEGVLEGLALEDFDKVRLHAHALYELSQAAEWHVHKTMAYERFSTVFRDNVSALLQHAMQDNVEGATLSYLEMTMTCVKCHSYMRTEGLARTEIEQPFIRGGSIGLGLAR